MKETFRQEVSPSVFQLHQQARGLATCVIVFRGFSLYHEAAIKKQHSLRGEHDGTWKENKTTAF